MAPHNVVKQTRRAWQRLRNKFNEGYEVEFTWVQSFENFINDMGLKPGGASLARIDKTGGYIKGNCVWASGNNLKSLRYKPTVVTKENILKARMLLDKGYNYDEIALRLNCSYYSVYRMMKQSRRNQ